MHTLSCFFLLHHHFQAVDDSFDIVSLSSSSSSSNSVNDDSGSMSDYSEGTNDESNIENIDDNETSVGTTINPDDEENQFIFDENTSTLICIGTTFNEIPQIIIDKFASKTKSLDLSHNRFRSLASIGSFTELEELILDSNDLDDVHTRFPQLANLKTLMINKNHLEDYYKLVDQLRNAYPKLEHLSLLGNEACPYRIIASSNPSSSNADSDLFGRHRADEEYQRYRHFVIFRLPKLRFLDSKEISLHERATANKLGDILNSIVDVKSSSGIKTESDRNEENRANYTPLPTDANKGHRISVGKVRHTYHGQNSEGNKFIPDAVL